jgi:uncharacterized MnhB-related membrane protein
MNYSFILEAFIVALLLLTALMAVFSKELIKSVIFMSLASMLSVVAFLIMHAPDVAITEASIGSGLVTTLFLLTLIDKKKEGAKK